VNNNYKVACKVSFFPKIDDMLNVDIFRLDSLRWFSQHCSRMPHFWGCTPRGLWPPNSNSGNI